MEKNVVTMKCAMSRIESDEHSEEIGSQFEFINEKERSICQFIVAGVGNSQVFVPGKDYNFTITEV